MKWSMSVSDRLLSPPNYDPHLWNKDGEIVKEALWKEGVAMRVSFPRALEYRALGWNSMYSFYERSIPFFTLLVAGPRLVDLEKITVKQRE